MSLSNVFLLLLLFGCGWVYMAPGMARSYHLNVGYGETIILPCDGSAFLDEDISVQWEAMGRDVAALQEDTVTISDPYTGYVSFASAEQRALGDWSIVVDEVKISDTNMYECIWGGRRTLSTVWLTVQPPQIHPVVGVHLNDSAILPCYLDISRHLSPQNIKVWWEKDGDIVFKRDANKFYFSDHPITLVEVHYVWNPNNIDKFPLHFNMISYDVSGEYNCWYQTKGSDVPKPGIPGAVTLIVYWQNTDPESSSEGNYFSFKYDEETTGTTETMPVLLDQVTAPMEVITEPLPMEAFEETVTYLSDEGSPDDPESLDWTDFPWVRTGVIGGVLLATALVICILGALHKL